MLSYTRQKKGAGRKLTRPDCIMGRREGTLGNAGGGRLSEKGALPQRAIAKNPAPGRLVFSRNAVSSAARRTSSTPSPCLLALRENPAPHRRVLFGNCSPPTRKALAAFRQCGGIRGLALRENPAPHRRVLFGNCSPPPGKRLLSSCDAAECAARRTSSTPSPCLLALRENPSPHRHVLFGNCSPPPGKRMLLSGNAAQCAACLARKSRAAQARSFRQLLAPSRKALAVFMRCGGVCGSTYLQYAFALPPGLARKSIAAQARSFRQLLAPTRKAHAAFRQCGAVRGLPCAKIPRRTGAFFSAIVRPHPESSCSTQAAPAYPPVSPTMQSPHNSPPSPKSTAKKRFPFGEGGAGGRTLSFF